MCVGILGDKARVVGRDAAEPMGSGRGHLQETVGRMACQYISNTQVLSAASYFRQCVKHHNSRLAARLISSGVK